MIPADIDTADLSQQLSDDGVAFNSSTITEESPLMEKELRKAVETANKTTMAPFGVVLLDHTPENTSDLRDIAQVLLSTMGSGTVVVRAPGSGAIVSTELSRAAIEQAQYSYVNRWDYAAATQALVHDLSPAAEHGGTIPGAGLVITCALTIAVIFSLLCTWFSLNKEKVN